MSQVWLIYGGNGWIGSKIVKEIISNYLEINIILGNERCGISSSLEEEIEKIKPDRVLCFIGRTCGPENLNHLGTINSTIDYLEQPGKIFENMRDNFFSPILLERICTFKNIHFTYLGTGCIFYSKPEDNRIYYENEDPNFFGSKYSIIKGLTDIHMRKNSNVTLNVRIRMPISDEKHPKNLLCKLLKYEKISDCGYNSMTVFSDLIPVLIKMIFSGKKGTIHLVNPEPMKHSEILDIYQKIVDPNFKYELMCEKNQDEILKAKRSTCVLSSDEMESYQVPKLKDSITRIFSNWTKV